MKNLVPPFTASAQEPERRSPGRRVHRYGSGACAGAPLQGAWPAALLLVSVALALTAGRAMAANANPPDRMTYQGFLVDGNGVALGNTAPKNYDVVFRIFDSQNTGTRKWAEQQTVTVDKGFFSVLLGEGSQVGSEPRPALASLFTGTDASDRFVEITVKGIGGGGGDVTILPRLRLLTSPYVFLARNAISAGNLVNNTNSQIVTISGSNVGINRPVPGSALDVNGTVTATAFAGNGASLTALNGANITTGTVDANRIPGLDASKITAGVLDANRVPNLDAAKIGSGTLNNARLAGTVGRTDIQQTYSGRPIFDGGASLNTRPLYLRGDGDVNHILRYCGNYAWLAMDGPLLTGWDGGVLGHNNGGQQADLIWDANGVTIVGRPASSPIQSDAQISAQHLTLQARDIVGSGVRLALGMSHVNNFEYAGVIQAYGGFGASYTTLRLNPLGGSVAQNSDRNAKTGFAAVDTREVLRKLAAMPVTTWKYKGETNVVHMGPTAQDFRAAFGLGSDDKSIGLPDGPGVTMAAIQGLHEIVRDKDAEIQQLKQEMQALRRLVDSVLKQAPAKAE